MVFKPKGRVIAKLPMLNKTTQSKKNWSRVSGLIKAFNAYLAKLRKLHPAVVAAIEKRLYGKGHKVFARSDFQGKLSPVQVGKEPYFPPRGWLKLAIRVPSKDALKNWPVAYHGSNVESAIKIASSCFKPPAAGGKTAHGHAGGTLHTTYLTPANGYASHPVYAPILKLPGGRQVQCILQLRVRPGHYKQQHNTLKSKHWDLTLPFEEDQKSHANIEWLVEDPKQIFVSGVMLREIGSRASAKVFGNLAKAAKDGFHLTKIQQDSLKKRMIGKA